VAANRPLFQISVEGSRQQLDIIATMAVASVTFELGEP
jgi:hypothetical protein